MKEEEILDIKKNNYNIMFVKLKEIKDFKYNNGYLMNNYFKIVLLIKNKKKNRLELKIEIIEIEDGRKIIRYIKEVERWI